MTKVTHLTLDDDGSLSQRRIHLREISGEADTPLETVGQDLRAARLRRGDDLATVSKSLKIRKDHLEALEEDRLDALPGRTYAVGFVRSYADYLGLERVEFVERFKSEIAGREEESETPAYQVEEERRLPQGWIIIAVVVLVLVIYGGYRLVVAGDSLLQQPVAAVPERIAPTQTQTAATPPITQSTIPANNPANTPAVSPQSTTTAQTPNTTAPSSDVPPANTQSASITPPASQNTQASNTQSSLAPLPEGRVYGTQNRNSRVILHVLSATRVLVEGKDGTVYINRTLQPGDSYRVPDLVGLGLTTPNGGAVELELDGQRMGHAGRASQMSEALSLDPQDIVDRYNTGQAG